MLSVTYAPDDRPAEAGASCRSHRRDTDTKTAVPYGAGPLRFVYTGTDNPACHVCVADGLRAGTHLLDNPEGLHAASNDPSMFHGHRTTLGRVVAAHDAHGAVDAEDLGRALSWALRHRKHPYSVHLRGCFIELLDMSESPSRGRRLDNNHIPSRRPPWITR